MEDPPCYLLAQGVDGALDRPDHLESAPYKEAVWGLADCDRQKKLIKKEGATWEWSVLTRWKKEFREVSDATQLQKGLYNLARLTPTPLPKTMVTVEPLKCKEALEEYSITMETMGKEEVHVCPPREPLALKEKVESETTWGADGEEKKVEGVKAWFLVEFKTVVVEDSPQKIPKGVRGKG
ncbi:hypothetical protein ACLOJK_006262 [Asimina triloba]